MQNDAPALMTYSDLEDFLQVSRKTIERWIRRGLLPRPIGSNRLARFRRAEVLRALEAIPAK